ncbi:unnamed protein product, partial [Brassica oleracea]
PPPPCLSLISSDPSPSKPWSFGFGGDVEFLAFGSSDSFDYGLESEYFSSDKQKKKKVVDKRTRFYHMLNRMRRWLHGRHQFGGMKNLLVINNMISFFEKILVRGHNVFTVVPDGCLPENFDYPDPILAWHWSALCSGNRSIDLYPTSDDDSGSSSPETDRAQGVKRASETDAAGSAT